METERDNGDVLCVAPVNLVPPREPLVDEVSSGEQTAVQCHVGDPGEPTDMSQKRITHIWQFAQFNKISYKENVILSLMLELADVSLR